MSIAVELPPELRSELEVEASRLGLSIETYLVRALSTGRVRVGPEHVGAELVAYWRSEGLIGARDDIHDSQQRAREIRLQAESRRR